MFLMETSKTDREVASRRVERMNAFRMLILGGTLDLIYGRRYGFVGRNGLGKSTLLRVMAK